MKICICTTPIRPVPTTFPPLGSLAVIQSLRRAGHIVEFYNIDYFRYPPDQVRAYFAQHQFDLVGISAVVSTAYAYTKFLSQLIREVSPKTVIVVGGNLAASSAILLRQCAVDYCVIGDGEIIIRNLVQVVENTPRDYARLKATAGIAFLDENQRFVFTGFGARPNAEDIESPDYSILEADGSLPYFITEKIDNRFQGQHRLPAPGERAATVVMTKGCVARCTFCHRWEKGFRARPVDQIMEHIKYLRDKYNVRFIDVGDENFGSDREQAVELARHLGELGMIWRVAGVRARTVTPETLKHWRANGCISVIYGIEAGSQKMLDIMEKNVTVEKNIEAVRLAYENNLFTVIQLVIAMPGETDNTLRETTAFMQTITPYLFLEGKLPSELMSVNYAQALPGTPLYEWAREHGFIGRTVEEEEKYLLHISDTDAYKADHFVNYTGLPMLKVMMWRSQMLAEVDAYYLQNIGRGNLSLFTILGYGVGLFGQFIERRAPLVAKVGVFLQRSFSRRASLDKMWHSPQADYYADSGYFNIRRGAKFTPLLLNPLTRRFFYPLLAVGVAIGQSNSLGQMVGWLFEYLRWELQGKSQAEADLPDKSLRKLVTIEPASKVAGEDDLMIPLRLGR
jgi:radical SAM superfamily enzyme YgiQ (UPF0313 family)